MVRMRRQRRSSGPGASAFGEARWARAACGNFSPYCRTISRAFAVSSCRKRSGRKRHERDCRPGISETIRLTTRALVAAASRPPLMVDRCLRTTFIAEIGAPEASSISFSAISLSSVRPSGGAGRRRSRRRRSERSPDRPASGPSPPPSAASMRQGQRHPAPDGQLR